MVYGKRGLGLTTSNLSVLGSRVQGCGRTSYPCFQVIPYNPLALNPGHMSFYYIEHFMSSLRAYALSPKPTVSGVYTLVLLQGHTLLFCRVLGNQAIPKP